MVDIFSSCTTLEELNLERQNIISNINIVYNQRKKELMDAFTKRKPKTLLILKESDLNIPEPAEFIALPIIGKADRDEFAITEEGFVKF